jgi:inhibitor of the pro-sigma K processing machinery
MEFFIGLIISIVVALLVFKSIGLAIKFLLNVIIGSLFLFLFNAIAAKYGLAIETTPLVLFFMGLFGLPAVVILIVIKLFI